MADIFVKGHRALPCYVLWGLWLLRNKMIFQGPVATSLVSYNIKLFYRKCWKAPKHKATGILKKFDIDSTKAEEFFDSAY